MSDIVKHLPMIKNRFPSVEIEALAERLGMHVVRHRALCPFHDDHRPSMSFSQSRGTWRCWSCGAHGDAADLVMRKLGIGFRQALRWAQDEVAEHGLDSICRRSDARDEQISEPEPQSSADIQLMGYVVGKSCLSADARRFLFDERRYQPQAVADMHIGSISSQHKFAEVLMRAFGRERSLASGLVESKSDGSVIGVFATPCLLFPYMDESGAVVTIQSRYLGTDFRVPRFQFVRGSRPGVFNLPVLRRLKVMDDLWVSEGITDCIALQSMGLHAVAIPSATLLNRRSLRPLSAFRLHMIPDADEPGEMLFGRLSELAQKMGTTLTRHSLPQGCKDVSEMYMCGLCINN